MSEPRREPPSAAELGALAASLDEPARPRPPCGAGAGPHELHPAAAAHGGWTVCVRCGSVVFL